MKDLLEISCGLDIHKEKIVACILTGPLGKPTHSEIREFTTLIPDMLALRDWIISENCHHIAMESTGIYWIPIYEILEDAFSGDITLLVVNARHMKNVPGKKTDIRDSEWISTLLRAGLLNASFIPEKRIREFRDLNRYRKSIIRDITSQKNRVEKFLQSSGFRLSSFISDIFGASGRNIILHLMEHGQIDKMSLDSYLKTKTRKRIVNAAGGNMPGATIAPTGNFFDLKVDEFQKVLNLNLTGTVLPTQVFLKPMVEQKKGAIVNFSSMAAFRPMTRVCGYAAAKAGISNFTAFMANEVATKFGEGIRVNAIAPGFFLTEQNRTLLTNEDGTYTQRGNDVIRQTPFKRFGKAEELCGTIQYLISDASSFVTGTVAVVDGGFNAFAM